jgi:hypothetical protein
MRIYHIHGVPIYSLSDDNQPGTAAAFTADSKFVFTKEWTNISLYTALGQKQWSKTIIDKSEGVALNYLFWVSPDASCIVAAMNNKTDRICGQIYFLKKN